MTPVLILAGPTASGKTAAGAALARAVGGEVVNADSMQVYDGLRVLTARPTPEEAAGVPHHMFGHVDPSERYSVGRYAAEAGAVIAEVRGRGRVPVIVGGTGLYLRALTEGLAPVPDLPAGLTEEGEARWARDREGFRRAVLAADPGTATLRPADRQRHVRAWAVATATGRTLAEWQAEPAGPPPAGPFRAVVLSPPREALYRRIDARWGVMMESGAAEEVAALAQRDLPEDLPVMKALGVRPLLARLRGELSAEEADRLGRRDSRRYAKRQLTWFRGQTDWPWAATGEGASDALIGG